MDVKQEPPLERGLPANGTFLSSTDNLELASPPYTSTQDLSISLPGPSSHSQYPPDQPSPAYASRVHLMDSLPGKEKERDDTLDSKGARVHYREAEKPDSRPPSRSGHHSRPPSVATTDTDNGQYDPSDEEYDWSGEDDLVDQEAKFEERFQGKKKKRGCFSKFITILFSSLIGSTFLAGVIVTPAILLHFYYYKPDPTDRKRYITDNVQAWLFWAAANILVSWYLALIVDLIPIFAIGLVRLAWGHISERTKSRNELYNSVKNTFKPVLYGASAWASWAIIFQSIYDLHSSDFEASRAQYTNRVSQAIEFFFFLALVVCMQRMLSHAVAYSFHRVAFKDRLASLNESLGVIEKLRDYKPKGRSGTRTPIGWGFSSVTEKTNFESLTGALKEHKKRQTTETGGSDADVEDERTMVGSSARKKAKRKSGSLFPAFSRQSTAGSSVVMESINTRQNTLNSNATTGEGEHRYPPSARFRSTTPGPSIEGGSRRTSTEDLPTLLSSTAKTIKTAVLHDARNIKGEEIEGNGTLGAWNVATSNEAKELARIIYYRLRAPGRNYLLPKDFHPAFETAEEAETAFRVFDKDDNGDLSRAEIKTTFLKVYRERRFLARSMRDVGVALKTLDNILLFFAMVILFFISLSVFGVDVGSSLTSVYSIGIAASFIFRNAASSAFDSIMFLFVTHPFDTGDRVFIDSEVLVVKQMGLFATVFTRADGTETYYFNSQLFTKFITNVRRSGKMYELATIHVAWTTPIAKLEALEKYLNSWLETEEHRWFVPSTSLTIQHIEYMRYMEITFPMGHNATWQDWGMRLQRRTAFYAALHYYCHQLGIVAYEATLPIVYGPPDPSALDDVLSPVSPGESSSPELHRTGSLGQAAADEGEPDGKEVKSLFGFYPPESTRERMRVRKGRKSKVSGAGQAGGD